MSEDPEKFQVDREPFATVFSEEDGLTAEQIREQFKRDLGQHGFAPDGGWMPEDFPQISVDLIAYTSNPQLRPDPHVSIRPDGWIYTEVGNVRFAIPDREEWGKYVHLVEAMLNTHERELALAAAAADGEEPDAPSAGLPPA